MEDWRRGDWFDSTDLPWTNPSPNMRSLKAAMLYPGLGMLEYARISVGRGTDAPFEQIGADFVGGRELAAYLNQRQIPGLRMYPTSFGNLHRVERTIFSGDRASLHHFWAEHSWLPEKEVAVAGN